MEYPEEIYATRDGGLLTSKQRKDAGPGWGRRLAFDVGYDVGYVAGKAEQADPLAGYSNLTAAIKAGEPIDWEKLDGLKVQCVNPEVGTLRWTVKRYSLHPADIPAGWWRKDSNNLYVAAFVYSWTGSYGWTIYVDGEIPMRRKTADQLEVGTYFLGQTKGDSPCLAYVGRPIKNDSVNTIYYAPDMLKAITPASEWVVLEEYGTFQKPEGK